MSDKSPDFLTLKEWLEDGGGSFHRNSHFKSTEFSGTTVVATEDIPEDLTIASCSFSLVITEELARQRLSKFFSVDTIGSWTERQWICTYLCLHWIFSDTKPSELSHYPYVNTLPSPDQLRTPLYFTDVELEAFKGSNLYHATLHRTREWKDEWTQCRTILQSKNDEWGEAFTWERYLAATTHISSRAFPSSLLSPTPTLNTTAATKPILIPGVDSLNHRRGQPVSWSISYPSKSHPIQMPTISLILHNKTLSGEELFNNYGAKPNSELILGYGFSLADNPDDTILLKIAGFEGKKWEVGLEARGAESIWDQILLFIRAQAQEEEAGDKELYEYQLDATDTLVDMVQTLLNTLPSETAHQNPELRPAVAIMLQHYLQGQRAILNSVLEFCREKEKVAMALAQSLGIELVIED